MSIYPKVARKVKVLGNLPCILEKLQNEGFLSTIEGIFDAIFVNEVNFASNALLGLEQTITSKERKFQLANNIFIFKENFKVICDFLGNLIS